MRVVKIIGWFLIYIEKKWYICIMNIPETGNVKWSETVIIVDADFLDHVAFDLIVNFERMIGRRIPQADMAQWAVCAALDGGLRPGTHETQVVLIHDAGSRKMANFAPADYEAELDGKAFADEQLGEFVFSHIPSGEMAAKRDIILDLLSTLLGHEEVKRLVIVPDDQDAELMDIVRSTLRNADDDKRITVMAMQPMMGGNFRQEILGYSLMKALGIESNEIK